MAERKTYLLRLDPAVFEALQRWAGDDLRSLNAQIEFLLRQSLVEARRLRVDPGAAARRYTRRDSEPPGGGGE